MESAERAADLTSDLLSFSRKGKLISTPVDVHKALDNTIALLEHSLDKRVNINLTKGADSVLVVGDDSQLQSAFLNIGINAGYAMSNGGDLTYATSIQKLDLAFCKASPFKVEPGNYLLVTIRDTGCGISAEHMSKIFEPFFTTKEQGKGTGLGLSAVYGTIQDHHGAIIVTSKLGVGTEFCIYLPLSVQKAALPCSNEMIKGEGHVLLVDDEELIRISTQATLEDLNYSVTLAQNGLEAILKFERSHNNIDLVVLDMIMPKLNGRETLERLREIDPNVKVIFASGFHKDEDMAEFRTDGLCGFIRKPFRGYELSKTLASALHLGAEAASQ